MTWAPDFEFYANKYKGNASQEVFDALVPDAVAHVNWLIGFNEVTEVTSTAYKRAVCAALEAFNQYGNVALSGFNIGSFSMSASATADTSGKVIATEAAEKELFGTGLLFGGLR